MAVNYSTQICRYDGKNCFVEAVTTAFQIRKVLFNFSQYDPNTNREQMRLEIYLDFSDALALSRMITNNRLMMLMCNAEREGVFAGSEVTPYTSYFTNMGGSIINKRSQYKRYEKAKAMFPGLTDVGDSFIVSKQFKNQRSSKNFIMVRGEYSNGEKISNGLIAPKGKLLAGISVSLTEVQAIGMAELIRISIEAYMNQFNVKFQDSLFPQQTCNVFHSEKQAAEDITSQSAQQSLEGSKSMDVVLISGLKEMDQYDRGSGEYDFSYRFTSFLALMAFEYVQMKQAGAKIKKCQNPECGGYFIARRSTAMYCPYPAPQDDKRTCKEYYPHIVLKKRRDSDEGYKLYRKVHSKLIKRRSKHWSEFEEYDKPIQDLNETYNSRMKEGLKDGSVTMQEFKEWISKF